jgi:hypothetical protein
MHAYISSELCIHVLQSLSLNTHAHFHIMYQSVEKRAFFARNLFDLKQLPTLTCPYEHTQHNTLNTSTHTTQHNTTHNTSHHNKRKTASADESIKHWQGSVCVHTYTGHTGVVRQLVWAQIHACVELDTYIHTYIHTYIQTKKYACMHMRDCQGVEFFLQCHFERIQVDMLIVCRKLHEIGMFLIKKEVYICDVCARRYRVCRRLAYRDLCALVSVCVSMSVCCLY